MSQFFVLACCWAHSSLSTDLQGLPSYTLFLLWFQKRLRETEQSLLDLEEKHRQAVATIKEKDYLISNLLKSGKFIWINRPCFVVTSSVVSFRWYHRLTFFNNFSEKTLVDRAVELQAELQNAASDVSNLFAKIGLYFCSRLSYCCHEILEKKN